MPTHLTQLEPRIYVSKWVGKVTREEILGGGVEHIAQEQGEDGYVVIIDAKELGNFPFDASMIRQGATTYKHAIGFLVVEPPLIGKIIAEMAAKITPLRFEFFSNVDLASRRAREMLAKHDARQAEVR